MLKVVLILILKVFVKWWGKTLQKNIFFEIWRLFILLLWGGYLSWYIIHFFIIKHVFSYNLRFLSDLSSFLRMNCHVYPFILLILSNFRKLRVLPSVTDTFPIKKLIWNSIGQPLSASICTICNFIRLVDVHKLLVMLIEILRPDKGWFFGISFEIWSHRIIIKLCILHFAFEREYYIDLNEVILLSNPLKIIENIDKLLTNKEKSSSLTDKIALPPSSRLLFFFYSQPMQGIVLVCQFSDFDTQQIFFTADPNKFLLASLHLHATFHQ